MEIALFFAGLIFIGFGIAHFFFPKRFQWEQELSRLSLLNRQIFMVHCGFIVLTLFLFGALCCFFPGALTEETSLGKVVSVGLFVFAFARLLAQIFIYDSKLWRGHSFNTKMHIFFLVTWSYLSVVFALLVRHQMMAVSA